MAAELATPDAALLAAQADPGSEADTPVSIPVTFNQPESSSPESTTPTTTPETSEDRDDQDVVISLSMIGKGRSVEDTDDRDAA